MLKSQMIYIISILYFALTSLAFEQKEINENPLDAQGLITPSTIPSGATADLSIHLHLAPKHHAYLDMFRLKAIQPENLKISRFDIQPVVVFADKFSKKQRQGIEGRAELKAVVEIPENLPGGAHIAQLAFTYQACTDDYCLLPKEIILKIPFTAVHEEQRTLFNDSESKPQNEEGQLAKALSDGWLSALVLVFLAGLLTSLTPCIFPMIPITLAILGTKTADRSRWKGFLLSLTYVLGIALTYSLLGVLAASTGALFGSLLGHPVAVSIIAFLFALMGLSMYGLFEIQVPAFIGQRLGQKNPAGYPGAFVAGLISGVVASPCVGPILIAILAYVGKTQDTFLGFWLLFFYALGMGQLFLLLGTFSQLLGRLPKSGPWMEGVKFIFGSTMIAMAIYYLYPVLPHPWTQIISGVVLVLISSFYGVFWPNSQLTPLKRLWKGLMIMTFILGVVFVVRGAFPNWLAGSPAGTQSNSHSTVPWQDYSPEKLVEAGEKGLPVVVDVYADWCVACKELDLLTFSNQAVRDRTQDFIWLQFDATKASAKFDALKKKYGIQGLPFVFFFDRQGKWRKDLTLTGFEKADAFLKRIESLLLTDK